MPDSTLRASVVSWLVSADRLLLGVAGDDAGQVPVRAVSTNSLTSAFVAQRTRRSCPQAVMPRVMSRCDSVCEGVAWSADAKLYLETGVRQA